MTGDSPTNQDERGDEDLVYDGICPVCGEEFLDGYDDLEEDESYETRTCIVELDGDGEGKMLIHIVDGKEEPTGEEAWEQHNESFGYDAPEKPAGQWSEEELQELYDRAIKRRTQWFCTECTGHGPMNSLRKARRHVQSQHGSELVKDQATPREKLETDTATDGGDSTTDVDGRKSANRALAEFSGGSDDE